MVISQQVLYNVQWINFTSLLLAHTLVRPKRYRISDFVVCLDVVAGSHTRNLAPFEMSTPLRSLGFFIRPAPGFVDRYPGNQRSLYTAGRWMELHPPTIRPSSDVANLRCDPLLPHGLAVRWAINAQPAILLGSGGGSKSVAVVASTLHFIRWLAIQ